MASRTTHRQDIAVLADDLTSAGDGAAPFRRGGHPARIVLSAASEAGPVTGGAGVTAVDLATRLLDTEAAAARAERAARAFAGSPVLLKTVDSTLRGHVAAEIRAAWAGSGRRAVVLAPAFPAEGRVTVDAVQYVGGVPVHRSAYADDPAHPVRCADLRTLFPEAAHLAPGRVPAPPGATGGGGLFICSAATDADLDRLVAAVPNPMEVLWAGSPGLAQALARRFPGGGPAAPPPPPARRPLVVAGSANPVTRLQVEALHRRGGAAGVVAGDDAGAAVAALRALTARVLTLRTPDERRTPGAARALARTLASAAGALAAEGLVDALVVTGGETAATVLPALGIDGLDLIDEPEPGVARATPHGRPGFTVLIKAGGFGDEEALVRLCRPGA